MQNNGPAGGGKSEKGDGGSWSRWLPTFVLCVLTISALRPPLTCVGAAPRGVDALPSSVDTTRLTFDHDDLDDDEHLDIHTRTAVSVFG